jgi:hemolysin activation/secretion protein
MHHRRLLCLLPLTTAGIICIPVQSVFATQDHSAYEFRLDDRFNSTHLTQVSIANIGHKSTEDQDFTDHDPTVSRLSLDDSAPTLAHPGETRAPLEPALDHPRSLGTLDPPPAGAIAQPVSTRSPESLWADQRLGQGTPDIAPLSIPPVIPVDPSPVQITPLFGDPLFEEDLPQLPPPEDLLLPVDPAPLPPVAPLDPDEADTIIVERFEFVGNTVIADEDLAAATAAYVNRPITLDELFESRAAATQVYIDAGYVTSGAFIPPQPIQDGVVVMEIVEGQLEAIEVRNNQRLRDRYIRSRLALGAGVPLNVNDLLEQLQLLQLDPRIQTLTAELSAGPAFGTSRLTVDVVEANTFNVTGTLDNRRSPSVGEFRQRLELREINVSGAGDTLILSYARTDGSEALEGRFRIFLNPQGGTLEAATGVSLAAVTERPFSQLNVESEANFVELTYRQPLIQRLNEELAVGITASRQQTLSILDLPPELGGPFPLSINGADENGYTRVVALRFFQDWLRRSTRDVVAVRSQFSLGLDALDATVNSGRPDSRFLAWRGQAQWLRVLAEDTLLLVRSDLQLSTDSLVPLEQFGIGGQETLRGYRRDLLLTDNGALLSAEVRLPVLRWQRVNGLLQVAPFIDLGMGWNVGRPDPDPRTLVSGGLGLLWQQDRLNARLDWGIPFVSIEANRNTWQENGLHFSINLSLR